METEPKPYLEYVDKEMTIMGILSGFCVAVLALVVDKIAGAKDASALSSLWTGQAGTWLIGAGALLVAALFFYRQRSHLAWYYGQISLAKVQNANGKDSVENWLRGADSWETWLYYRDGFLSLSLRSSSSSSVRPVRDILLYGFLWRAVSVSPCCRDMCSNDTDFTTTLGLTGRRG